MEVDGQTILTLFETLLEQQKAIRDVKVQVESLKEMMFEHRPQFRDPFAQQLAKANASEAMRRLDTAAARLEDVIGTLRKQLS